MNNKYEEALHSFDQAMRLRPDWPPHMVRKAFMYEKLEDYGEAKELYRDSLDIMDRPAEWTEYYEDPATFYVPDNYQAAKHLGDILLKQADESADTNNNKPALAANSEAIHAYRLALERFSGSIPSAAAVNNLGAALLMRGNLRDSDQDLKDSIEVLGLLTEPTDESVPIDEPTKQWIGSVPYDRHNPFFYLNLGYARQLADESDKAAKLYTKAAIESAPTPYSQSNSQNMLTMEDSYLKQESLSYPTLYPALNELGVLHAQEGSLREARSYFNAALEVREDYAHASHNLGVALLNSDLQNFLSGQNYLSRAAREDPSLGEASYDYISDNELYFLNLSLADNLPPDWQFANEAENSTGMVTGLALLLLLGRIAFSYAGTELRDTIFEKLLSSAGRASSNRRLPRFFRRLRVGVIKFMKLGVPTSGAWWMTPLALLASAPAIVTVMGWNLIKEASEAKWLMLGVLFYLTIVSLLVHHAGHALAALWFKMRVQEVPWPAGIVQAVALVIVGGPAIAPVPASVTDKKETQGKEREKSLIYLAGPAASLLFAALLFVLFLVSHISLLRLGTIVSLAVAVVSMLLLPPLDGGMVGKGRYTRLLFWTGVAMATLWILVYFSNQLYCLQSPGDSCWGVWF